MRRAPKPAAVLAVVLLGASAASCAQAQAPAQASRSVQLENHFARQLRELEAAAPQPHLLELAPTAAPSLAAAPAGAPLAVDGTGMLRALISAQDPVSATQALAAAVAAGGEVVMDNSPDYGDDVATDSDDGADMSRRRLRSSGGRKMLGDTASWSTSLLKAVIKSKYGFGSLVNGDGLIRLPQAQLG